MQKIKFKENVCYLKKTHYQMLEYMLNWIFGKKPPKVKAIDGKNYYWFSLQKIADDNYKSYYQVKTALRRLKNKDKSIDYGDSEPFVYAEMVYSRTETNKLYLRLNFKKIKEILDDDPTNEKLISKINDVEADMPALFDVKESEKNYSKNAEKIICDLINKNSDIFKTKIAKTKTFENCCLAVQDIYNGNFTNPRIYDISRNINTNQFDYNGWKEKIDEVKGDWAKIKSLIEMAVENYRLMFIPKNMPSNKALMPKNLDKWFYDEFNDNGYPSYFVFSLETPKPQKVQYGDNEADEIYKELPEKVRHAGNRVMKNCTVKSDYTFWKNLKSMYEWCERIYDSDINENIDYWVERPSEIIENFVDYCEANNILMTEWTFNVEIAFSNNTPFMWFINDAINKHKLNKKILKSCA